MNIRSGIIVAIALFTPAAGFASAKIPASAKAAAAKHAAKKPAPAVDHLQDIVTKYVVAMSKFQTLSVKGSLVGATGSGTETTELTLARPNQVRFVSKEFGKTVAALISDGMTLVEWNDHQAGNGGVPAKFNRIEPAFEMDDVGRALWLIILHPELLSKQPNLKDDGPVDLSGSPGRRIVANDGDVTETFIFSETTGLPVQMTLVQKGEPVTINFTNYVLDREVPARIFAAKPPANLPMGILKPTPDETLLKPGTLAPDFTLSTMDGRQVSLSSLRGHVVMVDFWATWCGPCRLTMKQIQHVYKKLSSKGLIVLSVNTGDRREAMTEFLKGPTLFTTTFLFDPAPGEAATMTSRYGSSVFPTLYLIDKEGKVVTAGTGYDPNEEPELLAELAKLGVS